MLIVNFEKQAYDNKNQKMGPTVSLHLYPLKNFVVDTLERSQNNAT